MRGSEGRQGEPGKGGGRRSSGATERSRLGVYTKTEGGGMRGWGGGGWGGL